MSPTRPRQQPPNPAPHNLEVAESLGERAAFRPARRHLRALGPAGRVGCNALRKSGNANANDRGLKI